MDTRKSNCIFCHDTSVSAAFVIFIGTIYERRVYVDKTTKQFRILFSLTDDEIHVTVNEILVTEIIKNPDLRSEN
jgi:hypothetical protein